MKKIFVFFCCFAAMFLMIGCGGGSKIGDSTDTGEVVNDEDSDTADSGSTDNPDSDNPDSDNPDTDPDDTDSDDPDTTPEQPDNDTDTTPEPNDDDADTSDSVSDDDADTADTAPDQDTDSGDTAEDNLNPLNLPVCSKTSGTPCIWNLLLIWSAKSPERKRWIDAVDYCNNLNEGGFSDWRLPDLQLLGTLIQNCDSGGSGCAGNSDGEYSVFGDIAFFWSSYIVDSSRSAGVYFFNASAQAKNVDETFDVRCVRIETTSVTQECSEIPEHAVYNTASEITLTWDWENYWSPSRLETTYNEEPSTAECRFKCEDNYFYDSDSGKCLNPCESNPCGEYSDVVCTATSSTAYTCECSGGENYFFDSDSGKCLNPCSPNPCSSISNSTGVCTVSGTSYICGCNSGYTWNGSTCASNGSSTLPECSSSNTGPCYDSTSHLTWSKKADTTYTWSNAGTYCDNLTEGGYIDWRLPTISELRTLIQNCSNTQMPGGSCGVTDSCLSSSCWNVPCDVCSHDSTGGHSKFGETGSFWSSSTLSDNTGYAWFVYFDYGRVDSRHKPNVTNVRCVR